MGQQHTVSRNNTKVWTDEGTTFVMLHSTVVVKFNPEAIILNSGGWRTVTTKSRMNQASNQYDLGYYVHQKNHEWFVDFEDKTVPFEDHMALVRSR